jgi:ATP-binding cassette subfamily B protein
MLKRKRFPVCYQYDSMDCGPSCLDMVARYHGRTFPRQFIKELCKQDRQGTSLATIARGAEQLGFRTLAVKVSFEELRQKAPLPCIAYWPQGHYVVVYRARKDHLYIADPSVGLTRYSRAEFETCWLTDGGARDWGILLLLEPTKQILAHCPEEASFSAKDILGPLWRDIGRHLAPIGLAVLVSLFAQLALPFLSAAVVDTGIANRRFSIVVVFLAAQLILFFSRLGVDLLQGHRR